MSKLTINPVYQGSTCIGWEYNSSVCTKGDLDRDINTLLKLKDSLDE